MFIFSFHSSMFVDIILKNPIHFPKNKNYLLIVSRYIPITIPYTRLYHIFKWSMVMKQNWQLECEI